MLEITVLGCGSSLGIPVVGCSCNVCSTRRPYNKRRRSAIYIKSSSAAILVDFGFDIKDQLIDADIKKLDAAILTHDHADHVSGIDNLRVFSYLQNKPLDIYTDHKTSEIITNRYAYLFNKKILNSKPVDFYSTIKVNDLKIQLFRQNHGAIDSIGVRINNFAYSSDALSFPEESKKYLQNLETWIVDCLDYKSTTTHSGLEQVMSWREELSPQKIFLTNMHHKIDYYEIINHLPSDVIPLYDGYKILLK